MNCRLFPYRSRPAWEGLQLTLQFSVWFFFLNHRADWILFSCLDFQCHSFFIGQQVSAHLPVVSVLVLVISQFCWICWSNIVHMMSQEDLFQWNVICTFSALSFMEFWSWLSWWIQTIWSVKVQMYCHFDCWLLQWYISSVVELISILKFGSNH